MKLCIIAGNYSNALKDNILEARDNIDISVMADFNEFIAISVQRDIVFDRILILSKEVKLVGEKLDAAMSDISEYIKNECYATRVVLIHVVGKASQEVLDTYEKYFRGITFTSMTINSLNTNNLVYAVEQPIEVIEENYGTGKKDQYQANLQVYNQEVKKEEQVESTTKQEVKKESKKNGILSRLLSKKSKKDSSSDVIDEFYDSKESAEVNEDNNIENNENSTQEGNAENLQKDKNFEVKSGCSINTDEQIDCSDIENNNTENLMEDAKKSENKQSNNFKKEFKKGKKETKFNSTADNLQNSLNFNQKIEDTKATKDDEEKNVSSNTKSNYVDVTSFESRNEFQPYTDVEEVEEISDEEITILTSFESNVDTKEEKFIEPEYEEVQLDKDIDLDISTESKDRDLYKKVKKVEVIKEVEVVRGTKSLPTIVEQIKNGTRNEIYVITGDRKTGKTKLATSIASQLGKSVPVLYIDMDTRRHGLLSFIDYHRFSKYEEAKRNSIYTLRNREDVYDLAIEIENNIFIMSSDYSSIYENNTIIVDDLLYSISDKFGAIIIDIDLCDLSKISDTLKIATKFICMEPSLQGIINFMAESESTKLTDKERKFLFKDAKIVFQGNLSNKDVKNLEKEVNSRVIAEHNKWSELPHCSGESKIEELLATGV